MKITNVARIVNAIGDWQAIRAKAAIVPNETTALRLRTEAAEMLLEVITDVLLEGTSADPSPKQTRK